MRTMTLEELLMKEDDSVLLDIYTELATLVVPSTGYAHAYCRKVNKLINAGELCTVQDKYRNVYLPTLSKMIFKEMSRRYAQMLYREKTIKASPIDRADDSQECCWCGEMFDVSELRSTELGMMCDHCLAAVRSRGEEVAAYD